jgi:deoxyadenosine/deoxycytidine kinase
MEAGITADYLSLLDNFYQDWLQNFDLCPVLTIRTQQLDYVHKPRHLNEVAQRVEAKLAGRDELILD